MNNNLEKFQNLSKLFVGNGFFLCLVGGTVRDYLLGEELTDMDAVTDATPEEMKEFLPDADFHFAKYGSIRYLYEQLKFDITTLRVENNYADSRHPSNVQFVKNLSEDVKRRDFTINGLYLNSSLEIVDYVGGQNDLKNHLIKCIGDPDKRIKEDPLRIIRAIRFAIDFDFQIEDSLEQAIFDNVYLLKNLNIEKIKQDLHKIKCRDKTKIKAILNKFNIAYLYDVIE